MAQRMLQRRGTATQWTSANTVMAAGEIGVETDTGQFKIGDGTTGWNSLPYFKDTIDLNIDSKAPIASPTFTGNVTLPSTTTIGNVSAAELAILDGVTATASEINVLDGITASTNELNILDGVTADASEINRLDGLLASTAELNTLVGITASTAELNILDGVTASTAELNTLDGVTASAAELNILDGATLTTTELNYVDGVTSAIQTQLNDKAPTATPTFTGKVTASDTTESTSTTTGSLVVSGGAGISKDVYIGGDLVITGDFTVNGTSTTVNVSDLTVEDPLIYIGEGNDANTADLGLVASFNDGTYQHSGLVRDSSAGKWKLFKGVIDEPTTTVNFAQGSLDTMAVGTLETSGLTATGSVNFTGATITGLSTLPSQSGNSGKYLTTNGTAASWATINATPAFDDLTDVTITSATTNDVMYYNGTTWVNRYVGAVPVIINGQTGTAYTLVAGDAGDIVEVNNSSAITVTVPTNASVPYPVGTQITILQTGAGQITVAGPSGGTLNATPGTKLRAQWSSATLIKRATDTWVLIGDLTA
jgi:hypothetical protein